MGAERRNIRARKDRRKTVKTLPDIIDVSRNILSHRNVRSNRDILPHRGISSHRNAPSRGATKLPTRRKEYQDPYNPAKMKINEHYSADVKKYLGVSACHVILDSEFCVTSKFLVNDGFAHDNIYAPNINRDECEALERFGVHAPHMSIEQFVCVVSNATNRHSVSSSVSSATNTVGNVSTVSSVTTQNPLSTIRPNAIWYDSMTNIGGNETYEHYAGVVLDNFLKCNMTVGRKCTVAVTLATRTNQPNSIHGTCEATSLNQIERLFAVRGFSVITHWHTIYKKNMMYAVWNLVHQPANTKSLPLLRWKDRTDRYVGFPAGYKLD